ncbi:copper resistance protein NlpE N-terminal domain-containing protein [Acinetobacter sp. B51(2017)]|uniref:copper resistance protein NlpE N-terminal domain-containing protein n=1 Tax=Acinetobacter sp. B51(2017) TaxID=2060938 RepID=UPI000F08A999|nr:copper resistance protein NlpE N-terminal domain-containing protein [Acinetobacter sp. B51(2017)]
MKKPVIIPLFAMSVVVLGGCQDSNSTKQQTSAMEQKVEQAQWVGTYQGTTPCMGCLSRCQDCPGMAVDLTLNQDMTYTLVRESLSGHNQVETLTGIMRFRDAEKTQLELVNVTTRNLLVVDTKHHLLEIREDVTANAYLAADDFLLEQPSKSSES